MIFKFYASTSIFVKKDISILFREIKWEVERDRKTITIYQSLRVPRKRIKILVIWYYQMRLLVPGYTEVHIISCCPGLFHAAVRDTITKNKSIIDRSLVKNPSHKHAGKNWNRDSGGRILIDWSGCHLLRLRHISLGMTLSLKALIISNHENAP